MKNICDLDIEILVLINKISGWEYIVLKKICGMFNMKVKYFLIMRCYWG